MVKQRQNSNDAASSGAILEFRPIVENSPAATIWSLRYSGTKRGTFGVLANTGEFKVIELAQHSHRLEPHQAPDTPFARAWASNHYTKATHHLRYPCPNKENRSDDKDRVVAYDFMNIGNPLSGQCALALHSNREVEVLKVPEPAPRINVSALEEIYKDRTCIARPTPPQGTVAEDLMEIQNRVLIKKYDLHPEIVNDLAGSTDKMSLDNSQRNLPLLLGSHPSQQIHEDILQLAYPDVKISLSDYLATLQTAKRRCQEGYSLGCTQNKAVVANDPWLVDIWNFIERMDAHAQDDGMVGNGLDLKYLGVSSIWANELTMYDERLIDPDAKTSQEMFRDAVKEIVEAKEFPSFEGVKTDYPENRQLCLSLCGWPLSKSGVQARAEVLSSSGEIYKAIVLAVFQGHKDIALSLLRRNLTEKKLPPELIGLAAVISCASPKGIPAEQREACAWMADMTNDPYLKSLLTYFITGDWSTVSSMTQLSLPDRLSVALKYLPDEPLTTFLTQTTAHALSTGFLSGILLTGLTNPTLTLLQTHISTHPSASALQTAVLILSRACPLYIQDARWTLWKESYLSLHQTWRTFLHRTRYIREHNSFAVTRQGRSVNKPTQPSLAIRCLQCQQNLALRKDHTPGSASKPRLLPVALQHHHHQPGAPASSAPKRTPLHQTRSPALACPNCGAQMPRCGLCMMWLGSPDASKPGAVETLRGEDKESRLMVFCMTCTHGFHGHHAREWFARHAMCPVPDCGCMCGLLK